MSDADAAMYQAKNQGRSRWTVFDENLSQQIRSRVRLEQELRAALNSDQIFLQFQPIIDFCTQSITGFEALVRWKHPTEGLIPPSIFIPIAEETGLIQPLGRVIFETAVTTLKLWQTHPRLAAMTMHVNLSPRQITQPRFHENLLESIVKASVPPERLTCEITESVLIQSFDTAKNSLEELSQHGIQICLDDFGTGYSSLSYLHSFPFDAMKLDRSFTKDMENSEKARNLVQSVLNLAHGLGFDLVAEGIETQAQLQTLLELGYQKGQGYLFSPPLDTADIVGFVEQFQFPVIKDKTH
jgi:EAL domain-containing protein (putative c-di-GMP-specific phosphodiesterase class I)